MYVQGWGLPCGVAFKLLTWLLGSAAAGNMAVTAPAIAKVGETGAIRITPSGLSSATKYLGSMVYGGEVGITMPNPTIVRIDTPDRACIEPGGNAGLDT